MHKLTAFLFTYRGAFVPFALFPAASIQDAGHERLRIGVGFILIAAGVLLRLLGIRVIGGRARVHSAGARQLLTWGIFERVRNPLYLGNALALGGLAALYLSLWGAPMVVAYLLVLYTMVVLYEEKCLLEQFGEPFQAYLDRVPRWCIRWRSVTPAGEEKGPVTPWSEVLRHERFFIAGYLALMALSLTGITQSAVYRSIPFPWIILFVVAFLFFWVGVKLQKKRGSWLAFDRTSGRKKSSDPVLPEGSNQEVL
jgi:protein-S-isoprenylcysteine O-methyltransferase Ste14